MQGKCISCMQSDFFGGGLIDLYRKKSGGIRRTYRHIGYSPPVSRQMRQQICSCRLDKRFHPFPARWLGVGGCEAAVHAIRRFLSNMPDHFVVVKIDFSHAFNCIRRDSVCSRVGITKILYQRFIVRVVKHIRIGQHHYIPQYGHEQSHQRKTFNIGHPIVLPSNHFSSL